MTNSDHCNWDYIIVGGGAAGCPLASRLTEHSTNKVLLLESGKDYPPGTEPAEILDLFAGTAHSNPSFTWPGLQAAFGPRPSNNYDKRPRRRYTQGRVIGGSSSVNGMQAVRGLPSDYANWAAMGAEGWDWDDVLPFFRKLETDRDFGGPLHGKEGPIGLQRYSKDQWPLFTRGVFDAVEAFGWKNIQDQNGVFTDGYFPVAYNHTDTVRIGPAWAYLTNAVRARPNLTILGEHHVERLLFENGVCVGVQARRAKNLVEFRAKEVILSAGALHTPVLLMHSGVGPAAELKAHGIGVVRDVPGVGKNLMEHPGVNLGCFMKKSARLPAHLRRQMFAGLRWSSGVDGCPAGDMYCIASNKAQWHAIGERIGLIMMWVNRSFSTGEVRLVCPDPKVPPDIDFNMASDPRDMERLVRGVRFILKLQAHPSIQQTIEQVFPVSYSERARKVAIYTRWNEIQTAIGAKLMDTCAPLRKAIIKRMIADAPALADLESDESACREWLKSAVHGYWHASGTCRMGGSGDRLAVTDPSGRVRGVSGLRVADASLMPSVPCANTNIPTVMIGEKIASAILVEARRA